ECVGHRGGVVAAARLGVPRGSGPRSFHPLRHLCDADECVAHRGGFVAAPSQPPLLAPPRTPPANSSIGVVAFPPSLPGGRAFLDRARVGDTLRPFDGLPRAKSCRRSRPTARSPSASR